MKKNRKLNLKKVNIVNFNIIGGKTTETIQTFITDCNCQQQTLNVNDESCAQTKRVSTVIFDGGLCNDCVN